MQLFKNKYFYTLLLISVLSHWYVFFDLKTLNAGDWIYVPPELLKNLLTYTVWNSHKGLGEFSSVPPNIFVYYLSSFLYRLSPFFTWQVFTRVLFIIPLIVVLPFVAFKAFYTFSKNAFVAFISSSLYMFNSFFLKLQLDFLTYALTWLLLPIQYLLINNFINTRRFKYLVFIGVVCFIFVSVELRLFLVTQIFFLFFYISYFFQSKNKILAAKNIFFIFSGIFIGLLPHLGWGLTTFLTLRYSGDVTQNSAVSSTNLFPSYHNLLDAFTLRFYGWQGNLVLESFIRQPTELRFLLIIVFFVIGVLAYRSFKSFPKFVAYWLLFSSLFFGLLVSQTNPPFGEFYKFLFDNFSLMKLYRESSKFFLPLAFSLSVFFGFGLYYVYTVLCSKLGKLLSIVLVFVILFFTSFYNLENFLTQKIGGMVLGKEVDTTYSEVSNFLSTDESPYYRVLWVPVRTRFGYYNTNRPFINSISLYDNVSNELSASCPAGDSLSKLSPNTCSNEILNAYSIKYIIVPREEFRVKRTSLSESEVVPLRYEHYGAREDFVDELDSLFYLRKLDLGIDGWDIFINEGFNEHISSKNSNLEYTYIKPHNYSVRINSYLDFPVVIEFSERYNPGWAIRSNNEDIEVSNHYQNDYGTNTFEISIKPSGRNNGRQEFDIDLYYQPSRYFTVFTLVFVMLSIVTCSCMYLLKDKLGLK